MAVNKDLTVKNGIVASGDITLPIAGAKMVLGTNAGGSTTRQTVTVLNDGFAPPSVVNGTSNGDKLVMWNSAIVKIAAGVENNTLWLQSTGANAAIKIYTGTSAAALALTVNADTTLSAASTVTAPTFSGALAGNASTATSIAGGSANRIPYNTAASTTSFVAAPTIAGTYLQWNGSAFTWAPAPFDIAQFINGKPLTSEILVKVIFPRAVSFAANFAGSYARCVVAATSATTLAVLKNGVNVGTVTFAADATTGTFATSALSFSAADVLVIQANATVDATFADVAFTLTGA